MGPPLNLAVFVEDEKYDFCHFLTLVLEYFVADGHRVTLVSPSVSEGARNGAFHAGILHVDATVVPRRVTELLPPTLPVLNSNVRDISKRRISELLVSKGDNYNGPVIIKTNANASGKPDRLRGVQDFRSWGDRVRHWSGLSSDLCYSVFTSKSGVPRYVWREKALVVERFVPEFMDGRYVLRKWVFLGDASVLLADYSSSPIVKAPASEPVDLPGPPPSELIARRIELGFDYGKFDYVVHKGRAILLDANSTPGISARTPRHEGYARKLKDGLVEWISRQQTR
jgi:hypothetical protein